MALVAPLGGALVLLDPLLLSTTPLTRLPTLHLAPLCAIAVATLPLLDATPLPLDTIDLVVPPLAIQENVVAIGPHLAPLLDVMALTRIVAIMDPGGRHPVATMEPGRLLDATLEPQLRLPDVTMEPHLRLPVATMEPPHRLSGASQ